MSDECVRCPKCGSNQIHSDKKGFSAGRAAAGTLIGGVFVGAVSGAIGKDKIILTCLKCSNTFKIGDQCSDANYEKIKQNEIISSMYVGSEQATAYKCSNCDKISYLTNTSYCPKCSYRLKSSDICTPEQLSKETSDSSNTLYIIIILIVVIVALFLLF